MKKVSQRAAAAAVSVAVMLTTCSCSANETRVPIERPQTISFSWWGNDTRSNYTVAALEEFEQKNPGIDVVPSCGDFTGYKENLDALFSCGKESDIIQINYGWLKDYSPDGEGFYDLGELSDAIGLENFTEEQLSYGTVDGKLNAIPISLNAVTFYYNQNIFDEYGLELPKTWDDLFTCAETLSKHGIYTLETADVYCWLMLTAREEQISGKAVFDENGEYGFDEQNVISMMEFYKSLIDGGVMPPYGEPYSKENYVEGSAAGQLLWISDAQYYVAPLDESGAGKTAVGDYLTAGDCARSGWYIKPTSLYAVSKNTSDPELTAKLLNFLLNDPVMAELQGIEKGIPLSSSALETLSANDMLSGVPYEASRQVSQTDIELSLMPSELENSDTYKAFFEQFGLYFYGRVSAEQAALDFLEGMQSENN